MPALYRLLIDADDIFPEIGASSIVKIIDMYEDDDLDKQVVFQKHYGRKNSITEAVVDLNTFTRISKPENEQAKEEFLEMTLNS